MVVIARNHVFRSAFLFDSPGGLFVDPTGVVFAFARRVAFVQCDKFVCPVEMYAPYGEDELKTTKETIFFIYIY